MGSVIARVVLQRLSVTYDIHGKVRRNEFRVMTMTQCYYEKDANPTAIEQDVTSAAHTGGVEGTARGRENAGDGARSDE